MAARCSMLTERAERPFCFTPDIYFIISFLPPNLGGRSSPNFATCLIVTQIFKIGSEVFGAVSPKNWRTKSLKQTRVCILILVNLVYRRRNIGPTKNQLFGTLIYLGR